jgi:hypothetical protein
MTTSENKTVYKDLCIIKEKEIQRLNEVILQLKETITDLQQYLVPPKFKVGDIVKFYANGELYIVEDFVCYDTSYALYNIHAVSDSNNFETVSEVDLVATEFF